LAKERETGLVAGVKNESVLNYSVQYNGYKLVGVTTVERGDGSYDSTSLFLYISRLLYLGTIHCTQQGLGALLYGSYRSAAKNQSPQYSI
jgi:hypothetical protein